MIENADNIFITSSKATCFHGMSFDCSIFGSVLNFALLAKVYGALLLFSHLSEIQNRAKCVSVKAHALETKSFNKSGSGSVITEWFDSARVLVHSPLCYLCYKIAYKLPHNPNSIAHKLMHIYYRVVSWLLVISPKTLRLCDMHSSAAG